MQTKTYIINQYRGLGDILFIIPLVRHLMKDGNKIIFPTIFIHSCPFRYNMSECTCDDFDIDNFVKHGDIIGSRSTHTQVRTYDLKEKRKYSVKKVLDMYKPAIMIRINGDIINMNLLKLENDIDEVLPTILPTLDYEEVLFDSHRYSRSYNSNIDINDYTLKILLNY